ncbi:ABC transporter substrate-binding protein [Halomonas sp. HAL1]|uniref:ABC transporter substrate-binding protein n=1 Tax=Halomonas sp. HAL1 TaxID=550984 RepID=UPI00022D34A4|nr:ABC transporter substrate-binding protein [Halomonas sp. HAL1]EHA16795.1 ABC transporter substrate-binding protein [Halomonas sp. HAL1]WKV92779.1 ABC transporter substrate-binding protein [Halomonas sp. HAL1]
MNFLANLLNVSRLRRTLLVLVVVGLISPVYADTPLRMVLNWSYQGPQAWFFLAQERGYFAEEGLDLTIDQGSGSGAAVGSVASGTYDVGFGDINALINYASNHPNDAPVGVYMIYTRPPFTIAVTTDSDIHEPADLEGKTIAGPANDGALRLFPAFASITDIDTDSIEVMNIEPRLREQMLNRGQVDAVFGFVNTVRFNAMLAGIDPDERLRFIRYGDYGMDLYSNALIVSRQLVDENPDAVRGLVRAINRAVADVLADPEIGMDAVMAQEPLINREVETARLAATIEDEMNHPELAEVGLGNIDQNRMREAIDIVVSAYGLEHTPELETVFNTDFLPPEEERIYSLYE